MAAVLKRLQMDRMYQCIMKSYIPARIEEFPPPYIIYKVFLRPQDVPTAYFLIYQNCNMKKSQSTLIEFDLNDCRTNSNAKQTYASYVVHKILLRVVRIDRVKTESLIEP